MPRLTEQQLERKRQVEHEKMVAAKHRRRHGEQLRGKREALKRHLQAGTISVSWILRCDKEYVQTMRIRTLLRALPSIGDVKVAWICRKLRIPPNKKLGEIPMAQREQLIQLLAEKFYKVNLSDLSPEQNRERIERLRAREQKRPVERMPGSEASREYDHARWEKQKRRRRKGAVSASPA